MKKIKIKSIFVFCLFVLLLSSCTKKLDENKINISSQILPLSSVNETNQPLQKEQSIGVLPLKSIRSDNMNFFITSKGNGQNGGNYQGLTGADNFCNELANAVAINGKTWKAYLSTSNVNAKDRIGTGPWYNYNGELIAQNNLELHTKGITSQLIFDELGNSILDLEGNSKIKQDHDVLTGSKSDGTVADFPNNPSAPKPTCNDWTSSIGDWTNGPYAFVGHADWSSQDTEGQKSWNSAHEVACSQEGLKSTAGSGKLYCFAS